MTLNNFYKDKKILITGNTGFKGSWLSKVLLMQGANVVGYSLKPNTQPNLFESLSLSKLMNTYFEDINNYSKLKEVIEFEKPEIIFHLAAQPLVRESYENPLYTFNTNVIGTANILEATKNYDFIKSIVMITTDKVYENKEWVWGYRENDRLGGEDPYSASKACAELVINSYIESFYSENSNCLVATARGGNVIGGGDWSKDRLIPDIIKSIYETREELSIRSPYAIRPWQHVLELLSGYLLIGKGLYEKNHSFCGSWNFGPNDENFVSVEELVRKSFNFLDSGNYKIENKDNLMKETNILKLNIDKAKTILQWNPTYKFDITIEKTLEWYQKFYNQEDVEVYTEHQITSFFDEK